MPREREVNHMILQINSNNYTLKGYMKEEIEKNLSKLSKYFSEDTPVTVTVTGRKNGYKVDTTIKVRNNILKSEVEDRDLNAAVDSTVAKMERQLQKNKTRLRKRNNDSIRFDAIKDMQETPDVYNIVRNKSFELIPMTAQEACFQLELLEHSFFVFLNSETNTINVVYKREDGDYGLIDVKQIV